jgi:hypothetical protein
VDIFSGDLETFSSVIQATHLILRPIRKTPVFAGAVTLFDLHQDAAPIADFPTIHSL